MSTTPNLNLHTWGESENAGNWLGMRLDLAGTGGDSNMMILDAWAATVNEALENMQDSLTFDTEPTDGSANPVTSAGIYSALETKANKCTVKTATLRISNWLPESVWYKQTLVVTGLTATTNGVVSLAPTADISQRQAARRAALSVSEQGNNTLTIIAEGDVPTTNIPICILLID